MGERKWVICYYHITLKQIKLDDLPDFQKMGIWVQWNKSDHSI